MTDPTPASPGPELQKLVADLLGRVTGLEQEVAALKARRGSLGSLVPYTTPTEEELHDMLHGPRGQSPLEVLEEYERKYLRGNP